MKKTFTLIRIIPMLLVIFVVTSCVKEDPEVPTKTKMEGVWRVVQAYDSSGADIMTKVENNLIPITAFYLGSDNTILSTAGPMTTYIVYGDHKWTQISSTIDQIFNYASLTFNGGEYFVADGVTDRFTLEMKLEGIGGSSTLSDILDIFGISAQWLKEVVYHKFRDVSISFDDTDQYMTWQFDGQTSAVYNMKDQYGDYVLWGGWPVNGFQRCKFVLQKKTKSLNDITTEAYAK
mgnify:CR=1 FL=1